MNCYSFLCFLILFLSTSKCQLKSYTNKEKRWEVEHENDIFKSKIDFLSEIFSEQLQMLKTKSKDQIEMVFLIDASSSVGEENFRSEVGFVRKLISDFPISELDTRVAIVTFGTEVVVHVNHLEPNDLENEKCSLINFDLPNIAYGGGSTFTRGAFEAAYQILQLSNRPKAHKIVFLVTDGFSNNGSPEPIADELKRLNTIIFTFGIRNGNVEELKNIASLPWNHHVFLLESFEEFEAMARKALHKDFSQGKYISAQNQSLCHVLCNEVDRCCDTNATCACGRLSGHFTCLCPPGSYGFGLKGQPCTPCPSGTYHDGSVPGDERICRPCPDQNHQTKKFPAVSIKDCVCNEGFAPKNDKCEVIKCPQLNHPQHGYFVNKKCSNVLHAACGVQCNVGFELRGSSVRICEKNSTWSGVPAACVLKKCEPLLPSPNAEIKCSHSEIGFKLMIQFGDHGQMLRHTVGTYNYSDEAQRLPVDTQCRFSCPLGFSHLGSKMRTCLPITRWDGLKTTCKPITCSSLQKVKHGNILPENCTQSHVKHTFQTTCEIVCNEGFKLKTLNSTRQCTGRHGTWTGKNLPYRCLAPPELVCPTNVSFDTDLSQPYATINMSLPEAIDNSGVTPIVWSNPALATNHTTQMLIGENKVTVFAMDASGNLNTCIFTITVIDVEPPKIDMCNTSKVFVSLDELFSLDLEDPVIFDNSGNFSMNISFKFVGNKSADVTYLVTDLAGNISNCTISVTLNETVCDIRPNPQNADVICKDLNETLSCEILCHPGFNSELDHKTVVCTNHSWSNDLFDGTWNQVNDCSVTELKFFEKNIEYEIIGNDDACDEKTYKALSNMNNYGENEINFNFSCVEINNNEIRRVRDTNKKFTIKFSMSGKLNDVNSKLLNQLASSVNKSFEINLREKSFKVNNISENELRSRCSDGSVTRFGQCEKCVTGTFHDVIQDRCLPCSVGFYQNYSGSTYCQQCSMGLTTAKLRSKKITDCKKICPKGKFSRRKCVGFSVEPCRLCPLGQYQDEIGKRDCKRCPVYTKSLQKGSISIADCIGTRVNPCEGDICKNGGKCVTHNYMAACLCPDGYIGSFCEQFFHPCQSNPCINGGICLNHNITNYTCQCPTGFTDTNCLTEVNFCLSSPCLNGGTCIPIFNGFVCQCINNFFGITCNVSKCSDFNPCLNEGVCDVDHVSGELKCECPYSTSGKYCEIIENQFEKVLNTSSILTNTFHLAKGCTYTEDTYVCDNTHVSKNNSKVAIDLSFNDSNVVIEFPRADLFTYLMHTVHNNLNLYEISATLWVRIPINSNFGTIFSFATNISDNAFRLSDYSGLVLYIQGKRIFTNIVISDNMWHFICITWGQDSGFWQIIVDSTLRASGISHTTDERLKISGTMVIGQDQDYPGGGFSQAESFIGYFTLVDFWNITLTKDVINEMYNDCEKIRPTQNIILSWKDLLKNVYGNVKVQSSSFCKKCGPTGHLYNGKAIEINGSMLYTCNTGYNIKFPNQELSDTRNNTWERKCLKTGEWEGLSPFCVRINCGFPGYFKNGIIKGQSYLFNETLHYSCKQGYILKGRENRTCESNGNWDYPTPNCQKVPELNSDQFCPTIMAPRFGSMFIITQKKNSLSNEFIPGNSVEFFCKDGYILNGSSKLFCQENFKWDFPAPSCEIYCTAPALAKTIGMRIIKDKIELYCPSTFKYEIIQCINGHWNVSLNFCSAKCTTPSPPTNSYLILKESKRSIYDVGEKVHFQCVLGYRQTENNYAICSNNGIWDFPKRLCHEQN